MKSSPTLRLADPDGSARPPQLHRWNQLQGTPMSARGVDARLDTPFALVGVRTEGGVVAEIVYLPRSAGAMAPTSALAERVCTQIEKYAADPGFRFKLPLKRVGSAFQRSVWDLIAAIPCGETRTYGGLARILRSAPRAVGQACGANYFPLVIPCHRVVAAGGIGGFANSRGGYLLEIKRRLLAHENARSENRGQDALPDRSIPAR